MLVRRIARPLLAVGFAADGLDAVRHPESHAARVEAAWRALSGPLDLPDPPAGSTVRLLVRAHGAALAVGALLLATGRAPRTAALALAALTLPAALVNQPFGAMATTVAGAGAPTAAGGAGDGATTPATVRTEQERAAAAALGDRAGRDRFVRTLTLVGGALLVAVDREGRPGLVWRAGHARTDLARSLEARKAVAAATAQATTALALARKQSKEAARAKARLAGARAAA